jgi:ring-1,2-phenylacetyl-CoA epoxidase subunit PaaE
MDEVFICGPEAMITATETALIAAGVPADRVHAERFTSGPVVAAKAQTSTEKHAPEKSANKPIALTVVLDGKQHDIAVSADEHLLDAALEAGLDLPYACKGGVCCTCRAKLLEGEVTMDKNFTLEAEEMAQGFVLSCQARALSASVRLSFDDR